MRLEYIKQVEKHLYVSDKIRNKIIADLEETFDSGYENGKSEEEVIEQLGSPQDFADEVNNAEGISATEIQTRLKIKRLIAITIVCFFVVTLFLLLNIISMITGQPVFMYESDGIVIASAPLLIVIISIALLFSLLIIFFQLRRKIRNKYGNDI